MGARACVWLAGLWLAGLWLGGCSPSPSYTGAFRHESVTGDLYITTRMLVADDSVEYSVEATKAGALLLTQWCGAPLEMIGGRPMLRAMACDVTSATGNRVQRRLAFDLRFDGSVWVRRSQGVDEPFVRDDPS